jgi:hypothetical protein
MRIETPVTLMLKVAAVFVFLWSLLLISGGALLFMTPAGSFYPVTTPPHSFTKLFVCIPQDTLDTPPLFFSLHALSVSEQRIIQSFFLFLLVPCSFLFNLHPSPIRNPLPFLSGFYLNTGRFSCLQV